jgi:hypothetical protein
MTDETIVKPIKVRAKFNLICASKCKKLALDIAKTNKFYKFTRVSEDFLISCEVALRNHIDNRVKSHPSVGKTLT